MDRTRMQARPKNENRFRTRGLGAAAAAVVGAGAAGEASATIIHTVGPTDVAGQFSIDGTIYSTFEVLATSGMMGDSLGLDDVDVGMMAPTSTIEFVFDQPGGMMTPDFLEVMTFNADTVDGTLQYNDTAWLLQNGTTHPSWTPGTDELVAFTYLEGGTNPIYGWMRITWDTTSSLTIEEWAYEDSGAPITVGYIPEPGTALLVGMGLAALGVAARRSRRP